MAAETIFACRYFKHPTDSVAGVTAVGITPGATSVEDPGAAGSPGPADSVVTNKRLDITVMGTDFAALLALVGVTAANGVIGIVGAAGALEKITVKNCYFNGAPQAISIPAKDGGGVISGFAISGMCQWGAADTFALMVLGAADF